MRAYAILTFGGATSGEKYVYGSAGSSVGQGSTPGETSAPTGGALTEKEMDFTETRGTEDREIRSNSNTGNQASSSRTSADADKRDVDAEQDNQRDNVSPNKRESPNGDNTGTCMMCMFILFTTLTPPAHTNSYPPPSYSR